MSYVSLYNSASVRGWQINSKNYSLLITGNANIQLGNLVTTSNANTTYTVSRFSSNNYAISVKLSNNNISTTKFTVNPILVQIRSSQSTNTIIKTNGDYTDSANSILSAGYISGPMGNLKGTTQFQYYGAGLAISENGNIIVFTKNDVANSKSNAEVWANTGNGWFIRNDFAISSAVDARYSGAALNGYGNILLTTNYNNGRAIIFNYDSNSNTWTETANLSFNASNCGFHPWLNYEGNKAIMDNFDQNAVVIWDFNGNTWTSNTVNVCSTINTTPVSYGQTIAIADNGNIIGTSTQTISPSPPEKFFVIYKKIGNTYELTQTLYNPFNSNFQIGIHCDITSDGKWLVLSAQNSNTSQDTILYYVNK